ncbi:MULTISPECIES: DUF805 domain-containing protein [Acidaminococcus]|uniref:Zinc-ribbon domain-containing protein n=1 Tax=Acidaminococcus intestini (strain RyC-MR95) TaxID=568816 RepID=G4Q5W8_ACIIR|nr:MULTISPECIES: DUF805 domain-containing protein [Acidaminococcus]AEQ21269.1 hypothetical protein Acin_0015 [Acidaminococcus intestini RyC-MR95]EEH91638.1 hypothetical protein ACDG_01997 [Acidaminococcus intestini]MCB5829711.1 DUF805 domain-containing protein [Acidaminococcus intestini]MCB6425349.1 DUF805 domain-containing protein [Acidaminococcus intestini]MCB7084104.1 DUF805 domain-containing protein [Acidaminococcus intestini]
MTVECPYCHEMIEETAQYCPHCGKAVIKSKAEVTPEKEKENLSMAEEGKKSQFQQEKAPKSAASYIKENIPNTENWQEMYLSTKGRISRSTFFVRWLLLLVTVGIISVVFSFVPPVAAAFSLIGLIMQITLGVRRLHDLGHSGLWAIIFCIPVLYFVILLALFFMKGDAGDNAYGPKTK